MTTGTATMNTQTMVSLAVSTRQRRIATLEAATGFRYDEDTGNWYNASGDSPASVEADLGYSAFYSAHVGLSDLLTEEMVEGWQEAAGYEDYCTAMFREEMDQAFNGWRA